MKRIVAILLMALMSISTLNAQTELEKIVKNGEIVLGISGNMTRMTQLVSDNADMIRANNVGLFGVLSKKCLYVK